MTPQAAADCTLSGSPPYNCEGCDLSGMNLAGKDLRQANLKNATLLGTIFKGVTSMDGADLTGATMGNGTDFTGCDLSKVTFSPTPNFGSNPDKPTVLAHATIRASVLGTSWYYLDLTGTIMLDLPADLTWLDVRQCKLPGIALGGRTLANAHFYQCDLTGADFGGANSVLNHIVFSGQSDLTGAKLGKAQINYGVFDTATLTGSDFTGATLANSSFLQARMDGTHFDGTDVTTCQFSTPPRFSDDPANLTTFRGATLNLSMIQKQWSYLDLTGAKIVGLSSSVDLTYLLARYAILSDFDLSEYTLNLADFTGATLDRVKFIHAKMTNVVARGVKAVSPHFDNATMIGADLSPDNGRPSSLRGATFNDATLTHIDLSKADLSPVDPKTPTTAAQFKRATMDHAALSQANLTSADFTGGVSLHGANFTDSTLKGADLSGAQLGSYSELFRLAKSAPLYNQLLTALQAHDAHGVSTVFQQEGVQIPPDQTSVADGVPGRSWTITVNQGPTIYQALIWSASDGTTFLIVSSPTSAASLAGAYMPNAKLLDANLFGVDASGIQLYYRAGATAGTSGLAGAVLDQITLANANLGGLDLTGASLYHASMTNVSLIGAQLKGATLTQATLDRANLAGADFTDVRLDGAHLSNAAVSVPISNTVGVHLFSLTAGDPLLSTATAELKAATKQFTLASNDSGDDDDDDSTFQQYLDALNAGKLDPLRPAFRSNGVTFSAQATVAPRDIGAAWEVVDPAPPAGQAGSYTVWDGFDDLGDEALLARPSIPTLQLLFRQDAQITLRWQTSVAAGQNAGEWLVDNDGENPKNLQLGYMSYLAKQEDDGSLGFYGTTLRIEQLGDDGKEVIRIMSYTPTILCRTDGSHQQLCAPDGSGSYLSPDTVCPNTRTLGVNQNEGVPWSLMLRAPQLPLPPTCVPSPYADCPQSSTRQGTMHAADTPAATSSEQSHDSN